MVLGITPAKVYYSYKDTNLSREALLDQLACWVYNFTKGVHHGNEKV
ncbi:unnamed protein product [marine sediment metagenome]|uniref:Uncharacterized protein n=1 Tax=marine sediment metagenome TaxID=412755 RepID=X1JZ72_9ZZZZ